MSPTKFHPREINGPRPSPLNINRDSHLVKKSSSSSVPGAGVNRNQDPASGFQQRHPVIIYTQSPKVIHTQARDFMALVQKLTGLSRTEDETAPAPPQSRLKCDENESSSVVTNENFGGGGGGQVNASPVINPVNPYLCDVPLFTPNSSDFFCSPRPVYRYTDSLYGMSNMGNAISSTFFGFAKGLPES